MTPRPDARERIIEAARQGLRELDLERLLSVVGVRTLTARAGTSTGALYHHVGSLAGLAAAAEEHVYTLAPAIMSVTRPGITELAETDFPLQVALDMHAADLPRLAGDPELRARMWVWALGGERARLRYRGYQREILRRLSELVERMQSAWDREPRPPFDYLDHVAVIQAGAQGAAFRQLMAPDPVLAEQYPRTQVAISTATLRRRGDHRDLEAQLVGMTYLPHGPNDPAGERRSSTAASRILFSAAELFRLQGFEDTQLAQVARRADVSPSTLRRYYDGKDAVALALLRSEVQDLLPGQEDGSLRHHLERVVEFSRPRMRYLAPYVASLLTGALPDDDPLLRRTRDLMPPDTPGTRTRRLLLVLLQRLHHDPDGTAVSLVADTLQLLGLLGVPTPGRSDAEASTTTW